MRAWRVAQHHEHIVGSGGDEIVAGGHSSEHDDTECVVAAPSHLRAVVVVTDGQASRVGSLDVGEACGELIGGLAQAVDGHEVAGTVSHIILRDEFLHMLAALDALGIGERVAGGRASGNQILDAGHKGMRVVGGQQRQAVGDGDVEQERLLVVGGRLGRVQDAESHD